uniref:UDENN domain-containing protein n=1 Tax=Setaria digitata TaxID=48799 RepID=A0A915PIA1_9BILA
MDSSILNVAVIGFHHKRGCQMEYCYPPLTDNEGELPIAWQNLPSLALPDGAHNVDHDVIYFLLPSLDDPNRSVFGISCYRQISAKDLLNKSTDVTRSTVQKSVCVLSRIPLFGALTAKLQLITKAYFNERDFAKVEVLSQMYENLCELFPNVETDDQAAIMGLVEKGLFHAAAYNLNSGKCSNESKSADDAEIVLEMDGNMLQDKVADGIIQGNKIVEDGSNPVEFVHKDFLTSPMDCLTETQLPFDCNVEDCSSLKRNQILDTDSYGFPLSIFTKGSLFHPYLSVCYLDMIRSDKTRAYCIGVTNALFVQRRDSLDVVVDEIGDGSIDIADVELKRSLTLTAADLRFIDFVMKEMETNAKSPSWEGSDDWIRLQMQAYLLSLIATARADLKDSLDDFNEAFVAEWKMSNNYRIWSCGNYPDLASAAPGHPFAGGLSISDVLLRVEHSVGATGSGRRVASAVANTSKYFANTSTKVKSSITSWLKGTTRQME